MTCHPSPSILRCRVVLEPKGRNDFRTLKRRRNLLISHSVSVYHYCIPCGLYAWSEFLLYKAISINEIHNERRVLKAGLDNVRSGSIRPWLSRRNKSYSSHMAM